MSLLKVAEVAQRLNCSVSTVYNLIESGQLPHHRCPGVRVSEEQITEYLNRTKREQLEPVSTKPKLPRARLKHIRL